MKNTDVMIVGAGPTGLMLALRLALHGVNFKIIDSRSGPGQASRAMVIQARTLEFYQQMGLAEKLINLGMRIEDIRYSEDERDIASLSWADAGIDLTPFPYVLSLPQDEHERFLVDQLSKLGINVEWNVTLKHFDDANETVRVTLTKDNAEQIHEISYLCSCEGARSVTRNVMNVGFPGGTYEQLFYVADVEIQETSKNHVYMHAAKENMILMIPMLKTGVKRLIGIVPPKLEATDELTFDDLQPYAESMLNINIKSVNWLSTYRVHHRVASHFQQGNVFLLGDAGHLHSPMGGQGMNSGLGDAVNLSWKLADVLKGRASGELLKTYEFERLALANELVNTTDKAFEGIVGRGWRSTFLRNWMLPHLAPMLSHFNAFRQSLFSTLSQIRINYRESSLSEGRSGTLQGGDRMPWIGQNFEHESSMSWHIQAFGDINPTLAVSAAENGIPIISFAMTALATSNGLRENSAYLVRPDAYIALIFDQQDDSLLHEYLQQANLNLHLE